MDGWDMSQTGGSIFRTVDLDSVKFSKRRSKKVIPTISEKWKKELAGLTLKPRNVKLKVLNPFITCPVCQGYLVDATTITECLHSFCRSCIVKHFEMFATNYTCPLCNELVHKTNPWYNLKADNALQDVVSKLIPGVTEAEERRRRVFYKSRGLPIPEKVIKLDTQSQRHEPNRLQKIRKSTISPQLSREPSPQSYVPDASRGVGDNDEITMQLEMKSMDELILEDIVPLRRKFVRCSNQVTVGLLQKFIAKKLNLEAANQIEIICNDMELGTDFTLLFIRESIADEEDYSKPLLLYYGLSDIR